MKKLFFTGEKGVGKTTLLNRLIDNFKLDVGGYFTTREFVNGGVKFYLNDYITKEQKLMADFSKFDNKIVVKETFEVFATTLLKSALSKKESIILDELGTMEENFESFKNTVFEVLNSKKTVIGVLKKCESSFVDSIKKRDDIKVLHVNKENRDELFFACKKYFEHLYM